MRTREIADQLRHVFWLGGMSGIGKTTAARAVAEHHNLQVYSLDATTHEHAALLPPETRTLDEIWVDLTPQELVEWFESRSAARFPLVIEDILSLSHDRPVIVDGPQLMPDLIAPLLAHRRQALYVIAPPHLQRELVIARGSSTYRRTRDPERAMRNRLDRDALLAVRRRAQAKAHGLTVIEVHDVAQTLPVVEQQVDRFLRERLT